MILDIKLQLAKLLDFIRDHNVTFLSKSPKGVSVLYKIILKGQQQLLRNYMINYEFLFLKVIDVDNRFLRIIFKSILAKVKAKT